MASPQVENGFLRIANEIIEALARVNVPGEVMRILLVVLRKTYGFSKKEDAISISQFCLSTGIKKPNCSRAIKKALAMKLVIRTDNGKVPTYRFNKDFDTWCSLSNEITLSREIINRYPYGYPQKIYIKKRKKYPLLPRSQNLTARILITE